jgi:hypothetical protein
MGRIDPDDPALDAPLGGKDPAPDPRGTAWYRFVCDIEDLLATGRYTWAEQTLRSIQLTVEQTQRVTSGQQQAVGNIEKGAYKSHGRRYEGFTTGDHRKPWDR